MTLLLVSNGGRTAKIVTGRLHAPACLAVASSSQQLPQQPPAQRQARCWYQGKDPTEVDPEKSVYVQTLEEPIYKLGKHRSNAMELVRKVPIIDVDREMAICDGGGGALGHPLQYIALPLPGDVRSCKYCALRYRNSGKGGHGSHH